MVLALVMHLHSVAELPGETKTHLRKWLRKNANFGIFFALLNKLGRPHIRWEAKHVKIRDVKTHQRHLAVRSKQRWVCALAGLSNIKLDKATILLSKHMNGVKKSQVTSSSDPLFVVHWLRWMTRDIYHGLISTSAMRWAGEGGDFPARSEHITSSAQITQLPARSRNLLANQQSIYGQ